MKKYNQLNQQLNDLQSQKITFSKIENLSLIQFIKYKKILSKENQILNQMKKISNLEYEINQSYNSFTQKCIENPKINCRKYCRLERKAQYKKEKSLYNLGLIEKKPTPILFQKSYEKLKPLLDKLNSFYQLHNPINFISNNYKIFSTKINTFKSDVIPNSFNKIAIFSAKKCIRGYKALKQDVKYFRNCMSNTNTLKYLKFIKEEALRQVNTNNCSSLSFRDYIKVDPVFLDPKNSLPSYHNCKSTDNKENEVTL